MRKYFVINFGVLVYVFLSVTSYRCSWTAKATFFRLSVNSFQQCTMHKLKGTVRTLYIHLFFKSLFDGLLNNKISFWTRSKAHSLHSYFPLYENKRESWIHSKHLLKRGIFSSTMFKLCFQTNIYLFLPICVYLVYIVISLWL